MTTIFTKIINGEIPCFKIMENNKFLAFLDIRPIAKGHTLVIPKIEIDYIFDMEDQLLSELIIFSKKVAIKIKKAIPCLKVGVMIVGLEIPHVHIHLAPISEISELSFSNAKEVPFDILKKTAEEIISTN